MTRLLSVSVLLYVASVVFLNLGFSYVPMIPTPIGLLSPMALLAGAVFVIRDFAQRKAGHWVLLAMAVATALSFLLANPFVAVASALAFAAAEIADYLVYTTTKKPFHQRVLLSSIISTPIDTLVFLLGINSFTFGTFVLMVASKLVAALVIWLLYRLDPKSEPTVTGDGIANPHWDSPTLYR